MDVGLDQAVTVTDPNGHHWENCDPMGGQVARGEIVNNNN